MEFKPPKRKLVLNWKYHSGLFNPNNSGISLSPCERLPCKYLHPVSKTRSCFTNKPYCLAVMHVPLRLEYQLFTLRVLLDGV